MPRNCLCNTYRKEWGHQRLDFDGINHILASRELLPRVSHQQILGKCTRYLANLRDYTEPLSKCMRSFAVHYLHHAAVYSALKYLR